MTPERWQRARELFHACIEADAEERTHLLRSERSADPELIAEVESLLAQAARSATFLEHPPAEEELRQQLSLLATERPGQRLGPYSLVRELGQGGMGTVWLAQRADGAFEREVALKLPRAEWTDRGLAERMARERAALASLNHPNIAQLFDAGWSESGRPYLAIEYVNGQPIDAWCHEKRANTRARLRIFVDVVRAVSHAHARLLVHRDLKPGNVLVGNDGRVKLLDFGIAKLLAGESLSAEETELTRSVGRALTLNYAAPEQILGQPVSTATDIYSLGVMLFELLCGEPPYRSRQRSRRALEDAITLADPPAPSSLAQDKATAATLRGDLDAIVLKALKKRPEHRYETASAFADDIERYLDGRPVRAQRDSRAYRLRRLLKRNKLFAAAAACVIAALTLGLSLALWQAHAAREQAQRATTISDFVLSMIQQADPIASQQTRDADVALLKGTEQRIDNELRGRPDLSLQMRLAIATAYRNRGEFVRAHQLLDAAIAQADGVIAEENLDLLRARVLLASWPILDAAVALPQLERAISILQRVGKPAIPLLVEAKLARHDLLQRSQTVRSSLADAQEALDLAQKNLGADSESAIAAAARLAWALAAVMYRPEEALTIIEPAYYRAKDNRSLGVGHPVYLQAQAMLGLALSGVGREAEGLPMIASAVESARLHHGNASFVTEQALQALSVANSMAGHLKDAIKAQQEAYMLAAGREPLGSVNRAYQARILAFWLIQARRPQEAQELDEESSIAAHSGPQDQANRGPDAFQDYRRAYRYFYLGQIRQAKDLLTPLLTRYEELKDREMEDSTRLLLSAALRQSADPSRAEPLAEAAVAIARESRPAIEPCWEHAELAQVKLALGKPQEALALVDEAIEQMRKIQAIDPDVADAYVLRGKALLNLGRSEQALTTLKTAHEFWQQFDAANVWAAEAQYWYGRALVVTGDLSHGKQLIAAVLPRLVASPMPLHQTLPTQSGSAWLAAHPHRP